MPSSAASDDQLALGAAALRAGLAVARGRDERGAHALPRHRRGGARGSRPAGVHTNTRSAAPSGRSSTDSATGSPSTSPPSRFTAEHPAPIAAAQDVVERRRTRTSPGGRHAGDDDAARIEERRRRRCHALRARPVRRPRAGDRPARRRAGLTSTLDDVGLGDASARQPEQHGATASRSTAGSPRTGPSSAWLRRSSSISSASTAVSGAEAERDVAIASVEHAADPDHDARPELRVAVHAGDQLAAAAHHGRDEHARPRRRRAGPRRARRPRRLAPRPASSRPRRTRPRSDLWAMASPRSFTTTGIPELVAGHDRGVGVAHHARRHDGTP